MIDLVWITITAWSPVLQITFSLLSAFARDSDAATPGHNMMISVKLKMRMNFIILGMKMSMKMLMRISMTSMKMRRGENGDASATQSLRPHPGI